jgi:RNA polymerase sigma-70 factor, ECF subfamily
MERPVTEGVLRANVSADDRALIRAYLAGEARAVSTVDGWIEIVLRKEFRALQGEWEDLRQDVRIRVLRNLRNTRFGGDSELRTYVHRIAKNAGIDLWRRISRRREQSGSDRVTREGGVDGGQAGVTSRDLLRKILSGLSAEERRLLELVHGQHLSYAEVARLLGVAEGTVKARVFRCRERLLVRRRRLLEVGD